jgi:hypothetical protein
MAALVAAIYAHPRKAAGRVVRKANNLKSLRSAPMTTSYFYGWRVDGRVKPGHDDLRGSGGRPWRFSGHGVFHVNHSHYWD